MKNALITSIFLLLAISSCQETESPSSEAVISATELETLLFMREEEKLAHDVYVYAFEKYGLNIFQNIANSESSHVLSVLGVMETFQVSDPLSGSTVPGEFTDPILINLYSDLINRVDLSLNESILVGLLIEDLDINDLEIAISETDKLSISNLYANLECGSKNHLRAFYDQANAAGITYTPEFISQSEYSSIVNSPKSGCNAN
ncbi:MAG: DUF2202 domain-containing protein [Algoriphagus sp.]|uniref:DUF2202 domain-containing protein n=1 Tax=Algoriphagus sp. TaxID=1872435 RepID=UPI0026186730|nr:DUF2202 domain-containing protein [Algoriphagus sp.]MDG1275958.1 DUF2202 domain-containing protein [Algoriphagus sp.]